ncbi:DUF551 domain-containing protein [Salmonella enterica subsp. enterica serovar Agbeni]|nr:DUF551 domain-containing protein [Salmonella enterica subsp. enterica serovar Aba]EHW9667067.1 DUF551 domain-containing protein [Salmonella enterica subsp. enterica serovar Agbeni]EIW3217391.1 DUF551 domain-containing protein [Salmonella enterica subsp. enterica serovar Agbeni]
MNSNKLTEWRSTLDKCVENYQSTRAWYEENRDSPAALDDMERAEDQLTKFVRKCGFRVVLDLLDEIDELQERRKADNQEPAGYHVIRECGKVGCSVATLEEAEKTRDFWNKKWTIRPYFYTAPPAPVVPDEWTIQDAVKFCRETGRQDAGSAMEAWNACRTAMLRGNHRDLSQPIGQQVAEYEKIMLQDEHFPVTPDGWIKCSDLTPETGQAVIGCVDFDSDIVTPLVREFIWTGSTFRRGVSSTGVKSNDSIVVTHWMPLPAAPKKD